MSQTIDQKPVFTHDRLRYRLSDRRAKAVRSIGSLSPTDVANCDEACLQELIRQFAIVPPRLRLDQRALADRIGEEEDATTSRKTGRTNHILSIPVEGGAEWLEEVRDQRLEINRVPLAFLEEGPQRIDVRLVLSPSEEEGALARRFAERIAILECYVASVEQEIFAFNRQLTEEMERELGKRKQAILRANREQAYMGLPHMRNPVYENTALLIGRLLEQMGSHMTGIPPAQGSSSRPVRSFIVHGHDNESVLELKEFLQNTLGLPEPAILRKLPGLGRTIIEKFERTAEEIDLVFVLLTPDDRVAASSDSEEEKRRARQNVIFEMGFFLGKLGRHTGRILLLHKGPIELPSDIAGIEYIDISQGVERSGEQIRRELRGLGILH